MPNRGYRIVVEDLDSFQLPLFCDTWSQTIQQAIVNFENMFTLNISEFNPQDVFLENYCQDYEYMRRRLYHCNEREGIFYRIEVVNSITRRIEFRGDFKERLVDSLIGCYNILTDLFMTAYTCRHVEICYQALNTFNGQNTTLSRQRVYHDTLAHYLGFPRRIDTNSHYTKEPIQIINWKKEGF